MNTTFCKLTMTSPLVVFLLLLPALTRAETGVQTWVQRYNGPGNGDDEAYAIAVDGGSNVIVTGRSSGGASGYDYATIKYSSAGVPLWTNRYNGPGNGDDEPSAVAVDGSNNVIVTGYSSVNGGGYYYATIKYSSAGVPLWTNLYNGPGIGVNQAYAVAVDSSNNVIVTGYSSGGASFYDYATIKYSSAGVPLWTNRYNGPANSDDLAHAVAVDGSNNVIVTGASTGNPITYSFDYATIKYSSAGLPLWTNRYKGPGNANDQARAVAVDASNDVIVTGYSTGSGNGYDYATIKYSGAGVPLWTNRYNGPGNGNDEALAIASDGGNNVLVTGYSDGGASSFDYATLKYSSAGLPLWTNRYNGPGNGADQANAVAVDSSNNVIVTGYSFGSGSTNDYATIKYSSAGTLLWISRFNGSGNPDDLARALAVDQSGNVIVTGYSTGSGGDYDFATVKYTCVPSPVLGSPKMIDGVFQMRVDGVLQPGTLVIQASTNLSTTNWASIFTNTTPTNVLFYSDPKTGKYPGRSYRVFQFP